MLAHTSSKKAFFETSKTFGLCTLRLDINLEVIFMPKKSNKEKFDEEKEKRREEREEEKILKRVSREYRMFKEEELVSKIPRTFYEKACAFSGKVLRIDPDKTTKKKILEAIEFSHLRVTPRGVASLALLVTFLMCSLTFMLLLSHYLFTQTIAVSSSKEADAFCVSGTYDTKLQTCLGYGPGLDIGTAFFIFLISVPVAIYLYIFPMHLKKKYEMDVGGDIVSAILYMVIYMRNNPSLENAVEFASRNISGPLSGELRKLMWDVRIGNYLSINDALLDYANRWKKNKEFVETIEILISSLKQTGERRLSMLDEAVRVILEGNRESARHYVQELKMPMIIINAMGMILPVMGLVLFPVIALFLGVSIMILFIIYDLALPLILFFVIINTLEKRPATYGKINISEHPDLPPPGKIYIGKSKRVVSVLPIAIMLSVLVIAIGGFLYYNETVVATQTGNSAEGIIPSLVITFGVTLGPAAYLLILNSQRIALKNKIKKMEDEFQEAMFQLGNSVVGGIPIETAMEAATKKMAGLSIKEMFEHALTNMRKFGMTIEQAFFDREYGAIRYYPSVLIKSVMKTVTESAKKGVTVASSAMFSMAKYLRGLHRTQEQVREALSDVSSSLKFQSYMLTPLITGVISTMAVIIIRIIKELSSKTILTGVGAGGAGGFANLFSGIGFDKMGVTPFQFIMVVSIYLVESVILLMYLMTGIESGEDPTERGYKTGQTLIMATIIYAITVYGTLIVFGPLAAITG